jgi:cell cycle protein kinase DBF2
LCLSVSLSTGLTLVRIHSSTTLLFSRRSRGLLPLAEIHKTSLRNALVPSACLVIARCHCFIMASFMANLFPKHESILPVPTPQLNSRSNRNEDIPSTPTRNSFITPAQTPQGSPSKNRNPPGAIDLPIAFESSMKLTPTNFGSPTKYNRQQGTGPPLSPSKSNTFTDDTYFNTTSANPDESIIHKTAVSPGSPLRKQGKENTPPSSRMGIEITQSQAALSRQEIYQSNVQPPSPVKKYNTQRGLTLEELDIIHKPNVQRLANVTQLCRYLYRIRQHSTDVSQDFLDYYFDLLTYVGSRQKRLNHFKAEYPAPPDTPAETYDPLWQKYTGRERANLRKRRVRLRQGDFQILTQVGQGGYGQVFLAQKKDTREVCALKVMSKKLLFKLDEVRHVLTERDILTNAKSEWLVRLLYSFQDEKSIYLAMVC